MTYMYKVYGCTIMFPNILKEFSDSKLLLLWKPCQVREMCAVILGSNSYVCSLLLICDQLLNETISIVLELPFQNV